MYQSTRSKIKVTASTAILQGLAEDGGLYVPEMIHPWPFHQEDLELSYAEIAFRIFRLFLDDFSDDEIHEVISKAYQPRNFKEKIMQVQFFDNFSFLELFHGPTLAFKDMALTILPHLLEVAKRKNGINSLTKVLVATSGDTGGAALSGFSSLENCKVIVLYPYQGVSQMQESQMLYYTNENQKAYAYEGNFDDCQSLVKEMFMSAKEKSDYFLTSANSINIGRLIPQIIYYFKAYFELVKQKKIQWMDKINVDVPTGNFGNILAAYLAKQMGLPIQTLLCCSNENRVLTDFLETGIYDRRRPFYKTNSPSMDILISSNLERLLYFITKDESYVQECMVSLQEKGYYEVNETIKKELKDFKGYTTSSSKTVETIQKVYKKYHYLIDPHTAVAYHGYMVHQSNGVHTLIVSTASPFKFIQTIGEALQLDEKNDFKLAKKVALMTHIEVPSRIYEFQNQNQKREVLNREEAKFRCLEE